MSPIDNLVNWTTPTLIIYIYTFPDLLRAYLNAAFLGHLFEIGRAYADAGVIIVAMVPISIAQDMYVQPQALRHGLQIRFKMFVSKDATEVEYNCLNFCHVVPPDWFPTRIRIIAPMKLYKFAKSFLYYCISLYGE